MTIKQLVRIGVFHIEEAILEILFQAGGEYRSAVDIAQTCGLSQSVLGGFAVDSLDRFV